MIVKEHVSTGKKLVAICDADLLGKTFEEGDFQLDLSSNFYQGEEKNEQETKRAISKCYIINAAGEESVKFLISNNLVEESAVKKIQNIPHVQVFMGME